MAVAVVNTDQSQDPAALASPGAGSNRLTYYAIYSHNATNGQYNATALTAGGQTASLIASVKAPGTTYREGVGVAVFRLLESEIASMANGELSVTWGDTDGTPSAPIYHMATLSGGAQTSPEGTPLTNNHDVLAGSTTWDPGDINGLTSGYILGFYGLGGGSILSFTNLTELEQSDATNGGAAAGDAACTAGVETVDTSAIDVVTSISVEQRPAVFAGFVVSPATAGANLTVLVPTGPWR